MIVGTFDFCLGSSSPMEVTLELVLGLILIGIRV